MKFKVICYMHGSSTSELQLQQEEVAYNYGTRVKVAEVDQ